MIYGNIITVSQPGSEVAKSHVGMIVQSVTLDTEAKVIEIYGGTSWSQIEGMFLLGSSDSHEVGSTGGSETNSHTHTVTTSGTVGGHTLTVSEMPSHNHSIQSITGYDDMNFINGDGQFHLQNSDTTVGWPDAKNASYLYGTTYGTTGGSGSHSHGFTGATVTSSDASDTNNMPPYKAVYIWERTA